ncbi:MAG TPA: hypothetical protein DDZ89_17685 [Clostridiales bacterium]|nr:hypothetical protein [Clostridiales bacterium]
MDHKFTILFPLDGDMLNERDGTVQKDGSLAVTVKVDSDKSITVNGVKASYIDGLYQAVVLLKDYANTILVSQAGGISETIKVYRLKNYVGKYRLSLDDNIWFLEDIAKHQQTYKSIFENPYLQFMKQVHDEYGTKIHINIYYETENAFQLPMMPDQYKEEWIENATWLRLSFHAKADKPDKPYIHSSYEQVEQDCSSVLKEIRRFAGEAMTGPVTTLHWGEATVEGCKALRDCGYKCLVADFNVDNELAERVPVSYYLTLEQRRNVFKRFIWKDNQNDIIFFRSAIIIDTHPVDKIEAFLNNIYNHPHQSAYMDLLIHEQYFYPCYVGYQPQYKEKILTAVRWAVNKGYQPAFLEECVFE